MIPSKDLEYINRKLGLLIWVNVITILTLVASSIVIVMYKVYWAFILLGVLVIIHLFVTYRVHVKLRKHSNPF
jgi:uncharacterized MnhB-related membrane protein